MPERQSSVVSTIAWLVAIVALLGGGWWGYKNYATLAARSEDETAETAESEDAPVKQDQPVASKVLRPTLPASAPPAAGAVVLESKGYIMPAHQILVSPKVSGMILELDIEEGRRVNKGDVLAQLEDTDYQAELDRAKATVKLARARVEELDAGNRPQEIAQAEAELNETKANLKQLQLDYDRNVGLRKVNAISQEEQDLSESQLKAMERRAERLSFALELMKIGPREERKDVARAELAQAQADLTKAEWRLGNCTIRAPISGTILKKNAEQGNIVNPIAFNGSFSLCEMADLSDLEVDLNIQERDISVIRRGQKCQVRAEAYPDRMYEGVVSRLMPIADRAKGAIPVRVKVSIPAEEEGVYLKPEMGVIVTFLNDTPPATAASP